MRRVNCPYCGRVGCEVWAEDGGVTAFCSETGRVREDASRVFDPKDPKREVRGKQVGRLLRA